MPTLKTYRELIRLPTFDERFDYLKMRGKVGRDTFGFDRYLNQSLYQSPEWKAIRQQAILRDDGCDLGMSDRPIFGRLVVHHLNPITLEDIEEAHDIVFDLNYLICTMHDTHNAIHYGDRSLLAHLPKERSKGDTCLWRAY